MWTRTLLKNRPVYYVTLRLIPNLKFKYVQPVQIVAMSDEDFQNLDYISLIENVKPKSINDKERKKILDLYIHADGLRLIEQIVSKKGKENKCEISSPSRLLTRV